MNFLILVAGPPASGKSYFAEYLSGKLSIPMISKDIVKEHLYDTVGFKCREEKVALGTAAMDLMYHFAETNLKANQSVILENNFENASKPGLEKLIGKYRCNTLTVLFKTDWEVLYKRFIERENSPERHRGHIVNTVYPEVPGGETLSIQEKGISAGGFREAFEKRGMADFSVGGRMIAVDTTDFSKVLYKNISDEIRRILKI